ncbi:MAG: U32 family peptidase [Bacilli bacterium]|nr:U32 family peptidase [Bacilli bacterium]MDD4406725.1 U32 family peptidase [Bacilli bacterium]
MKNNKILISLNNLNDIAKYKEIGITNFLFALEDFSIGYQTFMLKELEDLDINVYLNINIVIDTKKIIEFKKIINKLTFVKGIFFEDVGLYYILKDTKIPLIWNQAHFVINSRSINFWLERVESASLANELTTDEIKYILNNTNKPLVMSVYGLNMAMYSRRYLLTYFNKYNNLKLVKSGFLNVNNQNNSFYIIENKNGTALFYNKPFNYIPYLNEFDDQKILFYLINHPQINFDMVNNLINHKEIISEEKFLKEKTIYKLEG